MTERRRRAIHLVLSFLVLLDAALVVWAFALPDLWFWAFHGSAEAPELALLFLERCGANWAAFLLFQAVAWKRWRSEPAWLAIVAGIRWSDIFTDPTYALLSIERTWFSIATLPAMGVANLLLGWFLWSSYRTLREERDQKLATSDSGTGARRRSGRGAGG
jgi:hypothetical protein